MDSNTNNLIEQLSEKVHDAWWREKKNQGFHSPSECVSEEHVGYLQSHREAKDRFQDNHNPKLYKWCAKCHADMYPYGELSENIKDYDRVTVRTVLQALDLLGRKVI